jgi:hypothetical protein
VKQLQWRDLELMGAPIGESKPRPATRRFIDGRGHRLDDMTLPRLATIRRHLAGDYCGCSSYEAIVNLVESEAKKAP